MNNISRMGMKRTTMLTIAAAAMIAVQLLDMVAHIAIGQAEMLRIVSNIIIIVTTISLWMDWLANPRMTIVASLAMYLALNGMFVQTYGLTNPMQGDALRIALFVFIGITTVLTVWMFVQIRRYQKKMFNKQMANEEY